MGTADDLAMMAGTSTVALRALAGQDLTSGRGGGPDGVCRFVGHAEQRAGERPEDPERGDDQKGHPPGTSVGAPAAGASAGRGRDIGVVVEDRAHRRLGDRSCARG
jgi:hypothetical protein